MTSDGKPYAPTRFKEIVRERYLISKHTNTSYVDLGSITPLEREYLLLFIQEELEKRRQLEASAKAQMNNK